MGVQRLNHAVLYVRDVADTTTEFYGEVLGFRVVSSLPGAAFLQAPDSTNDHDLGVFQIGAGAASVRRRANDGWPVPPGLGGRHPRRTPAARRRAARARRTRRAPATTAPRRACTRRTPTGSSSRSSGSSRPTCSTPDDLAARMSIGPLDLPAEIDRFGADEPGGIGISIPHAPPPRK